MSKDLLWRHGDEYAGAALDPASVADDPLAQFRTWFREAEAAGLPNVNAFALATATPDGRPSVRMVLLKEIDDRGFVFYTNYDSRKGDEIAANPRAAMCIYWDALHRQVRIEGEVEVLAPAESDAYFASRPRASQLGAIVSPQSRPIASRTELDEEVRVLEETLGGAAPERPPHWGGFRVIPERVEFWQGQPSRLHDRVEYRLVSGLWSKARLAP